MKYTREFWFYPHWASRNYSFETTNDLFPVPSFNKIAQFLNKKGWEIDNIKYFEDKNRYGKCDEMRSLRLYCSKETDFFIEEESYEFIATKEGIKYDTFEGEEKEVLL